MIRSILMALKPAPSQGPIIDYAAALAKQLDCVLDACSVIDVARLSPAESVPLGAGAIKAQRDAQRIELARQAAGEIIAQAEATARFHGLHCNATVREGDVATVLANEVLRCDLLVCGHTEDGGSSEEALLHQIAKLSPRPVIVVPQSPFEGKDVLIAYDGSAPAARAFALFADSGLAKGRNVFVASYAENLDLAESRAETCVTFLKRHGIHAKLRADLASKDPAKLIDEDLNRTSAGLIVMGAFGRSAVRSFLFGSVTRSVLRTLRVPVLLAH